MLPLLQDQFPRNRGAVFQQNSIGVYPHWQMCKIKIRSGTIEFALHGGPSMQIVNDDHRGTILRMADGEMAEAWIGIKDCFFVQWSTCDNVRHERHRRTAGTTVDVGDHDGIIARLGDCASLVGIVGKRHAVDPPLVSILRTGLKAVSQLCDRGYCRQWVHGHHPGDRVFRASCGILTGYRVASRFGDGNARHGIARRGL